MKLGPRLTTLKCMAIGPLVVLLFAGCQSLFNPPRPELRLPTEAEIAQAAQTDYDFGPKRPPKDTVIPGLTGPSVADSNAPVMTIETMTRKRSAVPNPLLQMLARIESTGDYTPMGIRRGENFVWRDVGGTNWVSAAGSSRPHRLVRHVNLDRRAMKPHEPGLLKVAVNSTSFVVCLDDCPWTGHCGYQ